MKSGPLSRPALAAIAVSGIAGAGAVALGAAAAHVLSDGAVDLAETAARYALIHAVALLGTALALDRLPGPASRRIALLAAALFTSGIVLFSGGLAGLAFGVSTGTAPAGGIALIAAWAALTVAALAALLARRTS